MGFEVLNFCITHQLSLFLAICADIAPKSWGCASGVQLLRWSQIVWELRFWEYMVSVWWRDSGRCCGLLYMYAEDTIFATVLRMRQSLCVFILHCSDSYRWTGSFHWRSCFAMLWLQTYCLLLYVFGCTKQVFGNADRLHISKLTSINGLNEVQKSSHSSSRQVLYCTRLEIFQHSKLLADCAWRFKNIGNLPALEATCWLCLEV